MAKSPKAEAEEEVAEVTAKKPAGKKKLIIIVATVLLLGGGGGGAWFMLKGKHSEEGGAQAKTVKKEARHADKGAPPVFLPLEPFVVNLHNASPQSNDQFLQTDMTLRVAGVEVVEEIKQHMPEVRNRVIMLLTSKTAQELLTPDGKAKLAEAIRVEVTVVVDPEAVKSAPKPKLKKEAAEGEKAAEEAESEEETAEAEEPQSPEDYKVKSVLFTSFIIQ